MLSTGLAVAGSAIGLLASTGATSAAGKQQYGAVNTGVFLGVTLLAGALATPYAPRMCLRRDLRTAFSALKAVNGVVWAAAGLALLLGAPTMPVLLVAAVPMGVSSGLTVVLRPMISKAYLASERTAHATATMAIVGGASWAAGALLGGQVLTVVPFGWGLVANGLLTIVPAAFVWRVSPSDSGHLTASLPRETSQPWRRIVKTLQANRRLVQTALLGAVAALFLSPINSLVVPISEQLRQRPEVTGASYLLTAFAIGELASPWIVRRLGLARHDSDGAALAYGGAGVSLVALAAASALLTRRAELLAWVIAGIAFGAFRFAGHALYVGAAAEAGEPSDATGNLAAATLVCLLIAPFGTVLCSILIHSLSADAAVLISGACAIALAACVQVIFRSLRTPARSTTTVGPAVAPADGSGS